MYHLTILAICALTLAAQADNITLPTTGQAVQGVISTGSQRDANYTVTFPTTSSTTVVGSATSFAWIPNNTDPKWAAAGNWITPTSNGMANLAAGTYTFTVEFTLPAGVTSLASSLYCDDRVEVWLNGKLVTQLPNDPGSGYWAHTLSNFTATSGFLIGDNVLEFRVVNTNHNLS